MASYTYKVRDQSGVVHTGSLIAPTLDEASRRLRAEGKFIVDLVANKAVDGLERKIKSAARGINRRKCKPQEVLGFSHQLAVMIETGVPISEALDAYIEQAKDGHLKSTLEGVYERVNAGGELSNAMADEPGIFPTIMVSLVRAAEVSGTMGSMLERVSQYLTRELATARRVKGALTYPAIMLVLVAAVTVFLIMFVLPNFAGIYADRGAALPAPTKILMGLSNFAQSYWHTVAVGSVLAIGGLLLASKTNTGQVLIDTAKLEVPVIGPVFRKLFITRAFRTMGTMLQAGVPILEAVQIMRLVTPNYHFDRLWDQVDDQLRQGRQLSTVLFDSRLIPRPVAQMINAGERSGRLPDVMEKVAYFTEEELDEQIKTMTQLIEPAMTIVMGGIIGFIAIALLLPIFSAGHVMSQ